MGATAPSVMPITHAKLKLKQQHDASNQAQEGQEAKLLHTGRADDRYGHRWR